VPAARTRSAAVARVRALVPAIEFVPLASSGGQSAQKFETRISAIADFARKGKRKQKALPLFR
jgi:hypothetical protein